MVRTCGKREKVFAVAGVTGAEGRSGGVGGGRDGDGEEVEGALLGSRWYSVGVCVGVVVREVVVLVDALREAGRP